MNTPNTDGVIQALMTVFDPEFPLIDIWTMGLIYDIRLMEDDIQTQETTDEGVDQDMQVMYDGKIDIDMTFTTPNCPAIDYLPIAARNAINYKYPTYQVNINIIRDPMRTIDMLKDEDLKRMFE